MYELPCVELLPYDVLPEVTEELLLLLPIDDEVFELPMELLLPLGVDELFEPPRDEVLFVEDELVLLVPSDELLFEVPCDELLLELPREELLLFDWPAPDDVLLPPNDDPVLPDPLFEDELLFDEPNDELLFWLPEPEVVLFDDPNDEEPVLEELLSFVLLLELLFEFEDELLLELFDEPLFEVLPLGVEPKLDELLLLLALLLPLASVLSDEPVLVVLYSLSELLPPLFDQPELADSSDDEEVRPLPLPLLIETTFTCVSRRVSIPSSDESLLKLIPLEFNPVLPGGRDRLVDRLAGLMMFFDLMCSCFSSMTLNP